MRKLSALLVATAVGLCLAGGVSAELLHWEGTLTLHLPRATPLTVPVRYGVTPVATVNGSGGLGHLTTLSISGGITGYGGWMFVTDPYLAPLNAVMVQSTALGSGALRPFSGAAASGEGLTQNVLPVAGHLRFCIIFGACVSYLPVPLTVGGTRGMGIGGVLTVNGYGPGVQASMYGAPWTVRTAVVPGVPTEDGWSSIDPVVGFAHGPASNTSSTARIGGVVQLVTAATVVSALGDGKAWPLFGILTTHFVPEPETFLLFASGLAILAIPRHRRAKK
jgi:hypothetical protein